jgi:hypothetical protein
VARIGPGPLTRSAAKELTEFTRRARENAGALARLPNRPERWLPVTITAVDTYSNTYTGREDTFAADGTRYAHPNGRTFGLSQFARIIGIGSGEDALLTVPAEAWVRHAVTTADGDFWELDTACRCLGGSGGDGGGGGGGLVTSLCCPAGVAATQDAYFTLGSPGLAGAWRWVVAGVEVPPAPLEVDPGLFFNYSYIEGTATVTRVGGTMVTVAVMTGPAVVRDELGNDLVTVNEIRVTHTCAPSGPFLSTAAAWTFDYDPIAGCGVTFPPPSGTPAGSTRCPARPWVSGGGVFATRTAACPNPGGQSASFGLFTYPP